MKVLLINPPSPSWAWAMNQDRSIPIGLLYLGSSLQKSGFSVWILDLNNRNLTGLRLFGELRYYLKYYSPDIVGIACPFSIRITAALWASRIVKAIEPHVPVVMGGIHPTMFAKEILANCPNVDYVIQGEGEASFPELMNALSRGADVSKIDGLAFRRDGQVVVNEKKSFIQDLDSLPFPDYSLIDLKDYYFDTSHWQNPKGLPINIPIPLITSRSCPNRCNFCSMFLAHGKKWRPRSPKNVVDEIEYIYKEYGQKYFSIMDDNFTLGKARAMEIAREIVRRKLNIQFDAPNGLAVATLDKEMLDALVEAGLIRFSVGIESGSDYIRNTVIGKRLSTEAIVRFNKLIYEYRGRLDVKAFIIIGFPEETKETLGQTYSLLETLNVQRVEIFYAVPYPGTELFQQCVREKCITKPLGEIWRFEGWDNEIERPCIKPHALEMEDLVQFRERAYAMFKEKSDL